MHNNQAILTLNFHKCETKLKNSKSPIVVLMMLMNTIRLWNHLNDIDSTTNNIFLSIFLIQNYYKYSEIWLILYWNF